MEFTHRGYMDDVDIAYRFHTRYNSKTVFDFNDSNGCMTKDITHIGNSSHTGGSSYAGINALYAANMDINAINTHVGSASGTSHGADYQLTVPQTACIISAQAQVLLAVVLLENDAAEAKKT